MRTINLLAALVLLSSVSLAQADDTPEAITPPSTQISDIKTGIGPVAEAGQEITVHYTGWLYSEQARNGHGKKFDSSRDRAKPIHFVLGAGRVIAGWEQGLPGMQVGGKRTLIIPSELAYGSHGVTGLIPPDANLIFDVELLSVKSPAPIN